MSKSKTTALCFAFITLATIGWIQWRSSDDHLFSLKESREINERMNLPCYEPHIDESQMKVRDLAFLHFKNAENELSRRKPNMQVFDENMQEYRRAVRAYIELVTICTAWTKERVQELEEEAKRMDKIPSPNEL